MYFLSLGVKGVIAVIQTHPVKAEQSGEVRRLQVVDHVHELGAVDGVAGGEHAPGEHAQLQELRDRLTLGRL